MKELFDFLKSFEFWQSILYVIIVFIVVIVLIVITKPNIKIFNFSLSFFNKKNELPVFLQFKKDVEKKIYFIEYIGIIKTQMKKVDLMLHRLKSKLLENYADLISLEISGQEVATHTDYLSYAAHVEVMLFIRIRDKVRELILDEEITIPNISSEGFEIFAVNMANNWYECGKTYMDLFYGRGHVVSREAVRKSSYELMPEFERSTREILRDIKIVEEDMKKKIEDFKNQIRLKEMEYLGVVLT